MGLENSSTVVIYQGEDKPVTITVFDQNGDAFDLTNASEIEVLFKNTDGSALIKKMSAAQVYPLNAGGGKFKVKIAAADSIMMAVGDNQPIELRITIQGVVTFAQVQNAVTVLPSLFPGV